MTARFFSILLTLLFSHTIIAASPKIVQKSLQKSDTLLGVLGREGFDSQHLKNILSATDFPKSLSLIPDQKYLLIQDQKLKVRVYDPFLSKAYVFWREKESAGLQIEPVRYQIKLEQVDGPIHGSLISSIIQKIPSMDVAYRFMDAFLLDFNFKKKLTGNSFFGFTVEAQYDLGAFIKYGNILKTRLEVDKSKLERLFVPLPQGGTFVSVVNSERSGHFYLPVGRLQISSLFQMNRYHPIKHRRINHYGIDFTAEIGDDVFAAQDGLVLETGRTRASGNFVTLLHTDNLTTTYCHLSEVHPRVIEGLFMSAGDVVGQAGCTGYCTKPHVHFEVRKNNKPIDPAPLLIPYPIRYQRLVEQKLREASHLTSNYPKAIK